MFYNIQNSISYRHFSNLLHKYMGPKIIPCVLTMEWLGKILERIFPHVFSYLGSERVVVERLPYTKSLIFGYSFLHQPFFNEKEMGCSGS